jgi:hypothetical protein
MPRPNITAIRFRPPLAIARLGESDTPMEAFSWAEDTRLFGSGRTVLEPALTFDVQADGSIEPYLPDSIRFRDNQKIRPVCPFLELEADVEGEPTQALTSGLLDRAGIDLSQLYFRVIAANRKAQRQGGDPNCGFEARLMVRANDHARHDLLAWTHTDGPAALVIRERPVWLGAFQVIRPVYRAGQQGLLTDTIRVRLTPGRGEVYGPPFAIEGQMKGSRSRHLIVPERNRVLNPAATWCQYNEGLSTYPRTVPRDVYDGFRDLDRGDYGWGVVDDTCDAVITAGLSPDFELGAPPRPLANARVVVGPPHFSPDRRHIFSFADDLADRNPETLRQGSGKGGKPSPEEWLEAVSDLFRRIWETASQINLEAFRDANIAQNDPTKDLPGFPRVNQESMTKHDSVDGHPLMSARFIALADQDAGDGVNDAPLLPKAEYAKTRHAEMAIPDVFLEFMLQNPQRFAQMVRPPFRRMSDPVVDAKRMKPWDFRDALVSQSYQFDARMPPFLRDGDFAPLSLTRHQWDLLFVKNADGTVSLRTAIVERAYQLLRKK